MSENRLAPVEDESENEGEADPGEDAPVVGGEADDEFEGEPGEESEAEEEAAEADGFPPGAEVIRRLEAGQLREDRPELHPGDAVRVHATIREGDRERVQVFEGILIALKHGGNRRTITVRKTSFGVPVERIFPLHSPLVARIEVVRSHHVRRAKLYFLRQRKGKAARLRERRR